MSIINRTSMAAIERRMPRTPVGHYMYIHSRGCKASFIIRRDVQCGYKQWAHTSWAISISGRLKLWKGKRHTIEFHPTTGELGSWLITPMWKRAIDAFGEHNVRVYPIANHSDDAWALVRVPNYMDGLYELGKTIVPELMIISDHE